LRITTLSLAAALVVAGCSHSTPLESPPLSVRVEARKPMPPPEGAKALVGGGEVFNAACAADLDRARAKVAALKAMKPATDGRAILETYDEATAAISASLNRSGTAQEVHPLAAFRDAARECERKTDALNVDISQDRDVYDALSAVDLSQADAATRYWMERTLLDFRRAGVDRDDATRAKVKALNEEILGLGQRFNKNITEDVRQVELDPKELTGLPQDFIDTHRPGASGKVVNQANNTGYVPLRTEGNGAKARERVWRAYHQRAYPKNMAVLDQLIAKRHELATLLGYASWSAFAIETKMAHTPRAAEDFIDKVAAAAESRAKREHAELLTRKRKDEPQSTVLEPWDQYYYADRVQTEQLGFDSRTLRPYFEYGRVKQGVMSITSRMWGITFVPVKTPVWHPEVETYDVTENGSLLGRIPLDMHPQADKYPEGTLICNFPRPGELMTHDEVETFFHEFGHLLHNIFAGRQQWKGITGISTEWDFVETPSLLLQQWADTPSVLQQFARHHQTGEAIPTAMVEKLRASKEFGKGLWTRRQMFLSAVALDYYSRAPGFDTTAVLATLQEKYSPFRHEHRDGTYFQLAFDHLEGYSAAYYTYVWSLVIAKDLETEFQKHGYLDLATYVKSRKTVIQAGGSKRASELVKDFLGRPHDFDAYRAYLDANEYNFRGLRESWQ